ncbi:MAG: hypothetical protein OXC13_05070 [Caldilineaceae bacterium]|nr:hypothetical protein [Caldilineaceae bacterium]
MSEQKRLRALLCHLRCGPLNDVPIDLLLEPPADTRPSVMLVAESTGSWQVFLGFRSPLEWFKAIAKFLIGLVTLLAALFSILEVDLGSLWATAWSSLRASPPWLEILFQGILVPLGMVLAPTLMFLLTLFFLGQLSCTRAALRLDLNRLRCTLVNGPRRVPWRDVITVSPDRKAWIWVLMEDHAGLLVRVPKADRDTLVAIMGELIRHHHPHLHGLASAPRSGSEPTGSATEHEG